MHSFLRNFLISRDPTVVRFTVLGDTGDSISGKFFQIQLGTFSVVKLLLFLHLDIVIQVLPKPF